MTDIKGILFDIDGVLITSWRKLPGAVEALDFVRSQGYGVGFLTNTTSRPSREIEKYLSLQGFDIRDGELVSAARLMSQFLEKNYKDANCWLVNEGDISSDFTHAHIVTPTTESPDVIVLGGAGPSFNHDVLSRVLEYLISGVPVVAMHRSYFWQSQSQLFVDMGVYIDGLEKSSGKKIPLIGKPSPQSFTFAADILQLYTDEIIMIGDDMRGDVIAAQTTGMTGVLVKTGKFRQEILEAAWKDDYGQIPDFVINSVEELPSVLEERQRK